MYTINGIFSDLINGAKEGIRRLKVESGALAYDEGRRFRSFLDISNETFPLVIKFEISKDLDLTQATQSIYEGSMQYLVVVGGTEGGVFTPIFQTGENNKSTTPVVADSGMVISTGGTLNLAGSTILDMVYIKAASTSNRSSTVSVGSGSVRGFPATTAYVVITEIPGENIDPKGVIKYEWEVN
tara:strand:+ start:189 stop:740 length:552 start_codon:yes stop_codon:yes gene_type:complete